MIFFEEMADSRTGKKYRRWVWSISGARKDGIAQKAPQVWERMLKKLTERDPNSHAEQFEHQNK